MAIAAQRQFKVQAGNTTFPTTMYFATFSGGRSSADVTKVWSGGSLIPDLLSAPTEVENITLSKPWDPATDSALLIALRDKVGELVTSVTVTDTDRDLAPSTTSRTFNECLLVGVTEPEVDAASGDAASWEIEFAVKSIAAV